MTRSSDLLRRFRLLAVPGKAGIAGVPVDREAALREELAPVFAELRTAQQDTADRIAQANDEGQERRRRAALDARELLEQTREALPAAGSAAAGAETSAAESDAAAIRAAAHDEAARIRRNAAAREPALVDDLVRRVMESGRAVAAPS